MSLGVFGDVLMLTYLYWRMDLDQLLNRVFQDPAVKALGGFTREAQSALREVYGHAFAWTLVLVFFFHALMWFFALYRGRKFSQNYLKWGILPLAIILPLDSLFAVIQGEIKVWLFFLAICAAACYWVAIRKNQSALKTKGETS